MKPVRVVAKAAISALGIGAHLHRAARPGERASSQVRTDPALQRIGLARPQVALVPAAKDDSRDPATRWLSSAGEELLAALETRQPGFRSKRIGIALGTSTGGMASLLHWFEAKQAGAPLSRELAERACYHAPFAAFVERLPVSPCRRAHVLSACASATMAIGLGCRWLELGEVDLAICGGYDALNVLVCAGFESLGATTASIPAPFRVLRDGMALGEGAALLALSLDERSEPESDCVLGFGASSDAFHVTAPEAEGVLLARSAELALADAGLAPSDIGLVSAHATATPFNDLAEARALSLLFGQGSKPPVDAAKAVLGHTLGASGALETVLTLNHLAEQVVPAVWGSGEIIAELDAPLPVVSSHAGFDAALKWSAGFGGCNATLALGLPKRAPPPMLRKDSRVEHVGRRVTELDWDRLAAHAVVEASKLRHVDGAAELALAAVLDVVADIGPLPRGTALVVVSRTLGIRANHAFYSRLLVRGPTGVAPRLFPNTSPNLCASQCSIAFGLTGPCFAVDEAPSGGHQALDVSSALLGSGQSDRLLLVALEQKDEVSEALFDTAGWPSLEQGARAVLLGTCPPASAAERLDWDALRAASGGIFELMAALAR